MKKLIAGLSVVVLAAMLAFQPAQPVEAAAQGACPAGDSWFLVPTFLVIPAIDKGNWKDQNGDGLACIRIPAGFCGNRGQGAAAPVCGAWVWKENTN